MKKKGFTLIELLAVIVVLAVIALIATPTILGIIDKAKKGSLQDSAYGLVQAADLYYAQYSNGKTVRFDIEDNKITTDSENNLSYKGSVKDGTVLINNKGEITVCINDGKHAAYKNYKDTKVTVVDSKTCTVPENKYVVYLDNESTITEMTNQELTAKIEELEAKINGLETEKSNQTDVTNSINNLTSTHNSDMSSINIRLDSLTANISNNLEWKSLTTANGVSAQEGIDISDIYSNAREISIAVQVTVAGKIIRKTETFVIPVDFSNSEAYIVIDSGYYTESNNSFCEMKLTRFERISLNLFIVNGVDYTSSAKMWVIYR